MNDDMKIGRTRLLSLRTKILLAMAIVAAFVVAATLATNFHLRRGQLLDEFRVFVRSVAGTTALALDGDALNSIRSEGDEATPAFRQTRAVLENSRRINGLAEQEIYILRPVAGADPWTMEFVVMLQKKPFIGHRYTIPGSNRAEFRAAWHEGLASATGAYRDENGQWISGYAPIIDKTGKPVAVIEADAEVSRYIERERTELLLSLGVGLGAFVVAMLPGLYLANSITRGA